ncbi:hypothetical protein LPJ61_003588 [Coemansia biformis]|uniref:CCHC-type domain-containing protein n=1 Tax=Coemansia biformis TaxID=1286918 RepID=A0A9W7YCJ6_9FUNG|nr:hypothetical protein LPJ61_003588 [Coemansia biformis]
MTRVAQRAPKRPADGAQFVARPLMPKKSEIEQQAAREAGDGARETPKRGRGEEAGGDAPKRRRPEQTKAARGEMRRADRQAAKERGTTCFLCRATGHSVKNCPSAGGGGQAAVCYHCGADDHTTKGCPTPSRSFPFATCYVCGGRGHLASRCPKNEKGLYPNGGGCKYCGSTQHLMKDCRPTRKRDGEQTVGTVDAQQGGDDDDVFVALRRQQDDRARQAAPPAAAAAGPAKRPRKVVRF